MQWTRSLWAPLSTQKHVIQHTGLMIRTQVLHLKTNKWAILPKCYCLVLLPYLLQKESSYRSSPVITSTWWLSMLGVPSLSVKSTYIEIQLVKAAAFLSAPGVSLLKRGKWACRGRGRRLPGTESSWRWQTGTSQLWFSTDGRSRQTSLQPDKTGHACLSMGVSNSSKWMKLKELL